MNKEVTIDKTKNILRNICISTVILFVGIVMVIKSFKVEEGYEKQLYSYNVNKNVNYVVNLKENDYFVQKELDMDKSYISSIVDKINMDFSYSLAGNKKVNTKYIYQIVAISNVRYSSITSENNDPIWTKQYMLLNPKEVEVDSSNFVIKENIDVNFAEYNNEIKEFKKQFKMPIKADLQVKLFIRSDSKIPDVEENMIEASIMNVKMDLDEDVFRVEKDFKPTENKSLSEKVETSKDVNKVTVIIGFVLVTGAVVIILESIRKALKFGKKSVYEIALNRILKNYGDVVAEIVNPVEIDSLNIIDVKDFDQLLDIEEEIRMPILFYETIPGEQGEFIIVCDNVAYRYVIG